MGGALSNVGNVAGQGARTLLNVADLLMSARQGRLGTNLLQRAAALQDPGARDAIAAVWRAREDRYSEIRTAMTEEMRAKNPKVEMSYIGG